MYFFLPFGFINVIIFVVNPYDSYSTFVGADLDYPNRYVTTGVADLGWGTSIFNQVWNCDDVVLEILMDPKF